ncbi:formylmethanofuran dehydrogenase subunit C [Xanthobacter tagetidis]|uniref:Formylmethanofuran dehydrogenase subunit C n=1 Tax=Xanthobacter tagetidis TaxID=60216 RepID=A0A3L7A3J8_9HYPH|nr:formylmethanofuran dehydrogenase subunit C [Xanthobacter tagetidis]MBB6308785.1 formylmethanofuran dehydrogenase subunit C [Xanthobacter tagetidis]RLP74839.1 formylmethanofuran dehydrogenase subunit C [Xanthobacter tagetidis]
MSGLRLVLKAPLEARLDCTGLLPAALSGLSEAAAERRVLPYGTSRAALGDLFTVTRGASAALVISGDARLDFVGAGLGAGEILVDGPIGAGGGWGMTGGRLVVRGAAGDDLAAGLAGGRIEVSGAAGARLGGPLPGARTGMRDGLVKVGGGTGPLAGVRQRGGLILIAGDAGERAAEGMIAGTLAVAGGIGPRAGRGMRRGSLLLGRAPDLVPDGFASCGAADFVMLLLIARRVPELAAAFGGGLSGRAERLVGDRLSGGEGEILVLS